MTQITKQELNQMIKEEVRKQTSRTRMFESIEASTNTATTFYNDLKKNKSRIRNLITRYKFSMDDLQQQLSNIKDGSYFMPDDDDYLFFGFYITPDAISPDYIELSISNDDGYRCSLTICKQFAESSAIKSYDTMVSGFTIDDAIKGWQFLLEKYKNTKIADFYNYLSDFK
jgi:hypothetical protein